MSSGTLTSNALPAFVVYETITASSIPQHHIMTCNEVGSSQNLLCNYNSNGVEQFQIGSIGSMAMTSNFSEVANATTGRKKRRRRQKISKNKEEAENQRMTHIAVERNRRRLMNEHLAVLRSLMPESYIQRGDQASIVGGAIDYVKELEQHLQSLEVQKRTLQQQKKIMADAENSLSNTTIHDESNTGIDNHDGDCKTPPFSKFFSYPQYTWCHTNSSEYGQSMQECLASVSVGDIEVTLIETHANVRVLTARRPRQLLKIVAGLQTLRLSILHLNVTTMDAMVLYSLNLKVEEGCNMTTVDDIAAAVHHLLTLIEAETDPSPFV